jgi:hypothetical protein
MCDFVQKRGLGTVEWCIHYQKNSRTFPTDGKPIKATLASPDF